MIEVALPGKVKPCYLREVVHGDLFCLRTKNDDGDGGITHSLSSSGGIQ